ncbi:MAG: FtsQ-type POTRA domain-containing protein [Candidatus Omnitrophota bacterium]
MARRKKEGQNLKLPLKAFILFIFLSFFIVVGLNRIIYLFNHAAVFEIREVVVKGPALEFVHSRSLDNLAGHNIFRVDLEGVRRRVQAEYPTVDQLKIVRQLPNRILVTAEERKPFAVVSSGSREAVISEDGFILDVDVPSKGTLPYLTNINDIVWPGKGQKLASAKVSAGVAVIQELRRNPYLTGIPVTMIDLDNLSKIHLYFDRTEIILDRSKIKQKVEMLGLLFSDAGIPRDQINYVDLRFKEPAINRK